ncbi:MAG: hypothetical protein HFF73_14850 [Oscillospiraceae bacterium]|nr:hypothetical protein [Oscillospiraceae bacterium]
MDMNRMQELIQIYDEKLDTPDPAHVFEMRWAYVTSDWIKSLNEADRASVFEYIGYILNQAGESPKKLRTVMMLANFPCPETEKLMDKMIVEGTSKHTPFIMQYVRSSIRRM